MWKRRSFFLLEIVIALFLLSMLALPWLSNSLTYLRRDIDQLKEVEMQRIAELSFLEIFEKLSQEEFSWEELVSLKEHPLQDKEEAYMHLPQRKPLLVKRTFSIELEREKESKEVISRTVSTTLHLQQKKLHKVFNRKFFVEKSLR